MSFTTRFAPSPTGPLHLGHAYSAILAHDMAIAHGGRFLLRIEDVDQTRARTEWEEQIYDDLRWLGLSWETPVMRQSDRFPDYAAVLQRLWDFGNLLYPCHCTRRDIETALTAPQEGDAPVFGPDGPIYPGTCRTTAVRTGGLPRNTALRLDVRAAVRREPYGFVESGLPTGNQAERIAFSGQDVIHGIGDIVLSRRDYLGSYHLSVVVDDAAQGITHVIRGEDLFEATKIHVMLQAVLSLPTPTYHHHRLIRDNVGKRLAKRDDARAIRKYREDGASPGDIRRLVGLDA